MLINALALADPKQKENLMDWLNQLNPDPQEKVAAITEIYNEIGINQLAQEKINFFFQESRKYIDAVKLPEERKQEVMAYTEEMMKREY